MFFRMAGRVPRPTAISNLALTYRCNSRCITCGIWRMGGRSVPELTAGEIEDFLRGSKGLLSGVRTIQLTGGEPFLRDDIADVTRILWDNIPGAFVWIATNGLLPETIVDRVRDMLEPPSGGLGVTVSLDGVGETHDTQRGVRGSYLLAIRTLNGIAELREKHPRLRLSAGLTITPMNQGEIVAAMRIAEGLGADFTVRPVNVSDAYYRNEPVVGGWDVPALADSLREVAAHHLRSRGLIGAAPVISFLRGIIDYVSLRGRRPPCSAGSSSFFLDPQGGVYPCLFVGESMGNVRETPFEEVWSSDAAEAARARVKKGSCPGCWVECETMREIVRDKLGLLGSSLVTVSKGGLGIGSNRSSL